MDTKPCCTPSSDRPERPAPDADVTGSGAQPMMATCDIPGGKALVGTGQPEIPADEESPLRSKTLRPFRMMQTTVTNRMFAAFVADTGFVTEAETFGWSFVFFQHVPAALGDTLAVGAYTMVAPGRWCHLARDQRPRDRRILAP